MCIVYRVYVLIPFHLNYLLFFYFEKKKSNGRKKKIKNLEKMKQHEKYHELNIFEGDFLLFGVLLSFIFYVRTKKSLHLNMLIAFNSIKIRI